ncbi:muconolactone Delta-isomerase family protein [Streptosporangiaceae bacterium NEAU-GS5]|nr:muconolactone Delta-isomerase family protein [Streptosporangiaceae bacterium NEAU-GS5]
MEYLVTMTTHVPEGTSQEAVDDVRAREAAHSRELAAEGVLRRLWRPPLAPGEWRTLGLFAAGDPGELEKVLASMPLRVWRTDEVTPLSPHPNDPPAVGVAAAGDPEFFTTFTLVVPDGTPADDVERGRRGEQVRTRELGEQGRLRRLWRLPGQGRALGLWRARDTAEMGEMLASLPLSPWLEVEVTPLTEHPSDPERAAA